MWIFRFLGLDEAIKKTKEAFKPASVIDKVPSGCRSIRETVIRYDVFSENAVNAS